MIVLCILGLFWLGVRVATLWRMCPATDEAAVRYYSPEWWPREAAPAPAAGAVPDAHQDGPPEGPQEGPQDAPPAASDARLQDSSDLEDVWAPTRAALVVLGREVTKALGVSAARWAEAVRPPAAPEPAEPVVAPETPSRRSFFAVSPPEHGPACLGGRDDGAYLRGWDDAVHWVSHDHDAAPPTWGDVAYMTGWNHAVQAIEKARVSA